MQPIDVHWSTIGAFWASVAAATVAVSATIVNYLFFRSQVDPDVIVYAKADEKRPSVVILIIENIGRSIAKDVTFELPESFPRRAFGIAESEAPQPQVMDSGPLITGIPSLGPGSRRVILWGQYGGLHKALGDNPVDIKIRFKSERKIPFTKTSHEKVCSVDIKSFEYTDNPDHNWDKHTAEQLKRIADTLDKLTRSR